jgi:phosphate transport system substrate-binding protein
MKKISVLFISTLLLWTVCAFAGSENLRGKITIDGSSTVYPITEAAAASFKKDYPNVSITVGVSGTGGGFKRFVKGETDISDASRPVKPKEFKMLKEAGIEFIEIPVALDGLSVVINPKNTWVEYLSVEQLKEIYLETGKGKKWSDLNPSWPDKTIKVYSPGTDSGTFDYFKEVIISKGESFRPDMSVSEDDNVLVTGVSGDVYSIGYFGASYYFENKDKLKAVAIINPKTGKAVLPEPENVINGDYAPLSRPLFIYVNKKSLRRPEMRLFIDYYTKNSSNLAVQVDYVGLPKELENRIEEIVKKKASGTVFLDSSLEKREGGIMSSYKISNLTNIK